jgi:CTP synthase
MRDLNVLIIGDHDSEYEVHARTREAVRLAARGRPYVVNTRWLGPDDLQLYPGLVAEARAVVVAPPGPRCPRILPEPMIGAIETARTRGIPLLATGESHGLALIEAARNLLGLEDAGSTRYDEDCKQPVVMRILDEGEQPRLRQVRLDPAAASPLAQALGFDAQRTELSEIEHGLSPDYAFALAQAGIEPVLVDHATGRPYLHAWKGAPCHLIAAFLPQLSRPEPHPLFRLLIQAAEGRAP